MDDIKKDILNFIKSDNMKFLNVFGAAGTGKTTLLTNILLSYERLYDIRFTAPTHKAVSVLQEKIRNTNIQFSTIHSLLKCKMCIDENGQRCFKPKDTKYQDTLNPLKICGIILIDECSMIDKNLYKYIIVFQKVTDCKIIFVGDNYQLPPVGENNSVVFKKALISKNYLILKKNFRNSNLELVTDFRNYVKNDNIRPVEKYRLKSNPNIIQKYTSNKNPSKIILCWRNITVFNTNRDVRNTLWGEKMVKNRYNIGEKLICTKTFNIGDITIYSGEEIEVKTIVQKTNLQGIKYYYINDFYTIVHEKSIKKFETILSQRRDYIKKKYFSKKERIKQWAIYYKLSDFDNKLDYGYATTVHKSQGSGYDYVYVNALDIMRNKKKSEMKRCLYTAVSRHKKECIIY